MLEMLLIVTTGFCWLYTIYRYYNLPSNAVTKIVNEWQHTNSKRVMFYPAM